ncbi:CAP domain-containing protein [Streptomyces sp. PA03-1a]|nr:CAP domain-containing protein [Streptomyces sp. PA03-1a]
MSSHRKRHRARRAPSARSWPLAAAVATVAAGALVGVGAQYGNNGGKDEASLAAGDREADDPLASDARPETASPSPTTASPSASATPTRTVAPSPASTTVAAQPSRSDADDSVVEEIVRLVNEERASAGCRPVTLEDRLTEAAQDYTDVMARSGELSHTGPDGSTMAGRVEAAGYQWSALGENIAVGQRTAAAVMDAWMHSEGHRANILNCTFEQIGVGVNTSSNGPWWTQDFGTPR